MNLLERYCISLRHHPVLENTFVWGAIRPVYNIFLGVIASRKGVERTMNGTDSIRLHSRWRGIQEVYEPFVWKHCMGNVPEQGVVVDVGAFVGLYTIAFAKRVGPQGSVVAFEPESTSFKWLQRHVVLNNVQNRVRLIPAAVGDRIGKIGFVEGRDSQSRVGETAAGGQPAAITTLDEEFPNQRVDLIKVDVEGYEEKVLWGGTRLLKDTTRCPRFIYIEVHPYAWKEVGTTSESLLELLKECNYKILDLAGRSVEKIDFYGEIIAYKNI